VVVVDRPLVFGRRPDCAIVLHDSAVSGHHARISWDSESWQIDDLGSRNGTYVNGRRIAQPTALLAGDEIRMGAAAWRLSDTRATRS
jgi:pSer/pThr/pTyr-binding forkhead associated (FHA) protein